MELGFNSGKMSQQLHLKRFSLKLSELRNGINYRFPFWKEKIKEFGKYLLFGSFIAGFVVILIAYIQIFSAITDLLFNPIRWMK